MTVIWILLSILLLGSAPPSSETSVVYLVRHAEKQKGSDPVLTPQGTQRAHLLQEMLRSEAIQGIFSTDTRRTMLTATPLAKALGLEVEPYDHKDLPSLIEQLQSGRFVVVGHSNTTPEVVELLGGDPGTPIPEDEYDRLYIVIRSLETSPTTLLLRYGSAPKR